MKECIKCKEHKLESDFYPSKRNLNGFFGKCKECSKAYQRRRNKMITQNPDLLDKERARGRDKYHRLGYKVKNTRNL